MRSISDTHEAASSGASSRRAFLRLSAAGVTAAVATGYATGLTGPAEAADIPAWRASDIPPQQGRRILVTGGNGYPLDGRSGLGYHDALALARAGADVTIASRNEARGAEAVRLIKAMVPGASIRFERLDLSDLRSVRAFSARKRAAGGGLDVLINNAGVMGRLNREVSVDGFERVFATNTLGHFALTAELLPLLRKAENPRVVWVASLRLADELPFDDLQMEKAYDYAAAYDNSKLANLLLAFEIDRRSKAAGWGISSLAAHPGVARTNLIPDGPGLDSAEGRRLRWMPFLFQPAEQGALPTLFAATAPQAISGHFYGPSGFMALRGLPGNAPIPEAARDEAAARKLWSTLEQIGQISFG